MKKKIGVYICHCGSNIAGYLDVKKVAEYAKTLPYVVVARDYQFMCSDPGQDLIKNDIKELGLTGVLVSSCSPTLHLRTFREACAEAGLNPYQCDMATIRELCSWVHSHDKAEATEKAMALVAAGVRRVLYRVPLEAQFASVNPNTLIVGAGIAGIQAALEIASTGNKVYLVEKESCIGGRMNQLSKTFPSMDSAADILAPRVQAVQDNANIELLTCSEVTEVEGYIGNFKVSITKKAKSVDAAKCNGCGECWAKCPVAVPNEFDRGLSKRKAIYKPFAGAIPNVPVIDRKSCKQFIDGSCSICADVCPTEAIDFKQPDGKAEVEVGSCIVSTGYDTLDPSPILQYGYGKLDNVITSIEFERMLSANGPTGGKVILRNGTAPKSVAIAHCIGSRDQNYRQYCSRICCMYSLKYSHLLKEMLGPDASIYEMYIDMRCFGKGHEEFYNKVSDDGVRFIRGKLGQITNLAQTDEEKGKLVAVCEDSLLGQMIRVPVDMVVLSVAMQPRNDMAELSRAFLLGRSADGFLLERHPKLDPVGTMLDGVFAVGCCQGPKDISDSVNQATGAAARALELISKGRVEMEALTAMVEPEICSGCGYCASICQYSAVEINPKKKIAVVNEAVCKGCGACAATCPSKAVQLKNFDEKQLLDVIDEATKDFAGMAQ
ncbi:MAG TPA: CoB--CoM heterodisulfide reductase iron-sulfur subunit A family protein [Dehalococcoidales bacterium]|nr:CoB--CoM heterodisulfide reductase iron-sulfur subunit A family protein [Dehalococcoidales bacterium]